MMVFKRKQIVVLSLVLMIVVAGYLQYSYKRSSSFVAGTESGKLGEAVYVDNNGLAIDNQSSSKSTSSAKSSKAANDFFAQAKLDKDMTRSKDTEALKVISDDINATEDSRAKAFDQMTKVLANSDKEMRIETLIKEKGYGDALVYFGDDESLDIIVKAPNLSSQEITQISDLVARQANVKLTNVHIKNKF